MKTKICLVYLLAASHSGSTLTAMLLGAHPDICTAGELKATNLGDTERYRCSCQDKIKKCLFWQGIRDEMLTKRYDFDITNAGTDIRSGANNYVKKLLSPLHRGPFLERVRDILLYLSANWRTNLPKIQDRNHALIECITKRTGVNTVVDSSKIGIRLKYLLKIPEIELKIVRIVRDGRGVALTYVDPASFADSKNPRMRQGGTGGERESERLTISQAAHEWLRSNEEAESILRSLPQQQWTQIHYEQLCADPEHTLKKIFSFIGVDPDKINTEFRSVAHHIIGNGMRLDSTSKIKLDERWKTKLSLSDLDIFNTIAGQKNQELGYN